MSDFLLSSKAVPSGELSAKLSSIGCYEDGSIAEFRGDWGVLAVAPSRYRGFGVVETDTHIALICGGPVICWTDNDYLAHESGNEATRLVLDRWLSKQLDWENDLSGPFLFVCVDKFSGEVATVTDLMLFIPLYYAVKREHFFLGSHVDALADASSQIEDVDSVSVADFVLNSVITYPHTIYRQVFQAAPACEKKWLAGHDSVCSTSQEVVYWRPLEENKYKNIEEAAVALRRGFDRYLDRLTRFGGPIAQFISGGEDSRVLAGALSLRNTSIDAYVFLDEMNREGRIAEKVSRSYALNFIPDYRTGDHYLKILPEASRLIGSGQQYIHAHSLGFSHSHNLERYSAVFGGYLSDSVLKGEFAYRPMALSRIRFLPQFALSGERRTAPLSSSAFPQETLAKLNERRREHFSRVKAIRPNSAHEWFVLWPMTMRTAISNLHANRRLFASYEPFMSNEVVKVAAAVPVVWKLNRRLFWTAFRSYLKPTKYVRHADGRYPYFNWKVNFVVQAPTWLVEQVLKRTRLQRGNQGPWADWFNMGRSTAWVRLSSVFEQRSNKSIESWGLGANLLSDSSLSILQKVNALQLMYLLAPRDSFFR